MKNLEKQLQNEKKRTAPSSEFKHALWRELNEEWDTNHKKQWLLFPRLIAVPVAAIILFVTTGIGAYAYSSTSVAQGDALFPIKQSIERIEMVLATNPRAKARLQAKLLDRRLEEASVLRAEGKLTGRHLIAIARQLGLTVEKLSEINSEAENREEVRAIILEKIQERVQEYRTLVRENELFNVEGSELHMELDVLRTTIETSNLSTEEKQTIKDELEKLILE